jgi:hypothetical protein
MAKETKKVRKSGGKKAWRDRIKHDLAAGKKTTKVGNRRVSVAKAAKKLGLTSGGGAKKAKRKASKAKKAERRATTARMAARAPSKRAKKSGSRKRKAHARPKTKHVHHTRTIVKRRTVEVKVPRKTKHVYLTAAERRGRKGHRRARRGGYARERYAMDNPLSTMEVVAGGLTMLLGAAVADVSDRYWATHALTASTTGTTTTYTDTPVTTSATGMATFGTGLYPGMLNGASVIAPMNLTRWVSGGALSVLPFVGAAFVKDPMWRTALQMFGFGALVRIGGKAIVDLFAGLLGTTSLGQQLYVNELAATAQSQVALTGTTAITLPSPGTNPPTAAGPSGSASGLAAPRQMAGVGKAPQPSGCGCNSCAGGKPCMNYQPQQTVTQPAPTPIVTPVNALPAPTASQSTPLSQLIANAVNLPNVGMSSGVVAGTVGTATTSGDTTLGRPQRAPNPFDWANHITH